MSTRATTDAAHRLLRQAIDAGVFPAAAADAGDSGDALWQHALGSLAFDDVRAVTIDTPFDLASLTKPIVTATIAMQQIERGVLRLDDRVWTFFSEWRGADRRDVTVRDLLEHASGLPARLVDRPPPDRREFEHDICTMALEYAPRTRSIYSDLGFVLLGFLLGDIGGGSLADQFASVQDGLLPRAPAEGLRFTLGPDARHRAAPTRPLDDDPRRGRLLVGEVHDNYAAALGGVAGHAGLFGSAPEVGAFARAMLRAARGDDTVGPPLRPDLVRQFVTRSTVPGSSRALGWDTMLPTSSCGTRMSSSAFGHVGFTGTSLWIDPQRDRYFVLLTNRANGGGSVDQMREVRRALHDALAEL